MSDPSVLLELSFLAFLFFFFFFLANNQALQNFVALSVYCQSTAVP